MKWETYKQKFNNKAIQAGLNSNEISVCLTYAESLFNQRLPIIYDQLHFSSLVGYDIDFIRSMSNAQKKFYRKFKIIKKNGNYREIAEPYESLKEIQKWIMKEILYKKKVSSFVKSYVKKKRN